MLRHVYGISLSLSSFEQGLWFDHDERAYQPEGWGIRVNIVAGRFIRPIPKLGRNAPSCWNEPWFVLRLPFVIGPFVAIAVGRFGFYLGLKTFLCRTEHNAPERYGKWLRPNEKGADENPAEYLTLSATIRATRWR